MSPQATSQSSLHEAYRDRKKHDGWSPDLVLTLVGCSIKVQLKHVGTVGTAAPFLNPYRQGFKHVL